MKLLPVVLLSLSIIAPPLWASGSYVPRPPRHLIKTDRKGQAIDPERYGLGRAIVLGTGEVRLPVRPDPGSEGRQRKVLDPIESRLPTDVRSKARLAGLAGRLNDRQLEGVVYYLSIRFPQT